MPTQRSGPVEGTPAEAAVLTAVLTSGPISRAEIGRLTGLSSAAVTRAAHPLVDAGYLRVASTVDSSPSKMGRPSLPLAVNARRVSAIGINITAAVATGVLCDLAGVTHAQASCSFTDAGPAAVIDAVAQVYGKLRQASDAAGFQGSNQQVGLSISGDVDHTSGRVRYSPFLDWRGVDLGAMFAARTGGPVVVENDVKALAAAEQWFGIARGRDNFAIVTIGTGIGCALVINGSLVHGAYSVAGEIGHLPVGSPDVTCHCGGRGCVEGEASTAALLAAVRSASSMPDLSLAEAARQARDGDAGIAGAFAHAGRLIGRAIASVVNLLGPEDVIVSGEGLDTYDLMAEAIRTTYVEQAFGAAGQATLHLHPLPAEEWARGAATVAIEQLAFPSRGTGARRTIGGHHV